MSTICHSDDREGNCDKGKELYGGKIGHSDFTIGHGAGVIRHCNGKGGCSDDLVGDGTVGKSYDCTCHRNVRSCPNNGTIKCSNSTIGQRFSTMVV